MKTKELRDKTDAELGEELLKLRREQFNLRMQAATGQSAKPDQPRRAMVLPHAAPPEYE